MLHWLDAACRVFATQASPVHDAPCRCSQLGVAELLLNNNSTVHLLSQRKRADLHRCTGMRCTDMRLTSAMLCCQDAGEETGPLAELEAWKERAKRLNGIDAQLGSPDILRVGQVLQAAHSTYFSAFTRCLHCLAALLMRVPNACVSEDKAAAHAQCSTAAQLLCFDRAPADPLLLPHPAAIELSSR